MAQENELTKIGVERAATRITMMPFFPGADTDARAVLIEDLVSMVHSDAEALWIAHRLNYLYKAWPGLGEMRAMFCKCFIPKDGNIQNHSDAYPDGFPIEDELPKLQIPGLPTVLKIPAPAQESYLRQLEAAALAREFPPQLTAASESEHLTPEAIEDLKAGTVGELMRSTNVVPRYTPEQRQEMKRAEQEIADWKPTLDPAELEWRKREVETALEAIKIRPPAA
jgi:hypothetical protein